MKHVRESEDIADNDIREQCNEVEMEDSSDSEVITDLVATSMKELSEPDITIGVGPDVNELILHSEYRCNECREVFKFRNLFCKHVREHEKMWLMASQYCGKRFRTLQKLNRHIIRHSNYKPYECEHCGLCCRLESTLVSHKMIHCGDKPFLCSTCGMSFRNCSFLMEHMRMHSDIKYYQCEECGAEFCSKRKFALHSARHEEVSLVWRLGSPSDRRLLSVGM